MFVLLIIFCDFVLNIFLHGNLNFYNMEMVAKDHHEKKKEYDLPK